MFPRQAPAALLAAAALFHASAVLAQTPHQVMLEDWERNRQAVLSFVDAVPDSALGFRPTPDVRTFAEQIEHIALDNARIIATGVEDTSSFPDLGDPAVYLHDRRALKAMVNRAFDYMMGVIEEWPADRFLEIGRPFGAYELPKWKVIEGAREHSVWTLGQLVPYLRMNGVTPPSYRIF